MSREQYSANDCISYVNVSGACPDPLRWYSRSQATFRLYVNENYEMAGSEGDTVIA